MISLSQLLKEVKSQPIAIFITGASGSGKTYIKNKLNLQSFKDINSDNEYENLLKQSGLGLKIKDFDSEKLYQASKFQKQALGKTETDFKNSYKNRENIIIDTTGSSYDNIKNKKSYLELYGYKTYMIMVYVHPLTSLERNSQRERSLRTNMILKNWIEVYKNIISFELLFKSNFYLIKNDNKEHSLNIEDIKQYYNTENKINPHKNLSKSNDILTKLESSFYKIKTNKFTTLDNIKFK